ncbi:MAG: ATP-binding protein [candidate division WOR-3 bacterium]
MQEKNCRKNQNNHNAAPAQKDIDTLNSHYMYVLKKLCECYLKNFNEFPKTLLSYVPVGVIDPRGYKGPKARFLNTLPDFDFYKKEPYFEIKEDIFKKQLQDIILDATNINGEILFEKICNEYKLEQAERIILALLYFHRLKSKKIYGITLLNIAGYINKTDPIKQSPLLETNGQLFKSKLIVEVKTSFGPEKKLPFEKTYQISIKAFKLISGITDNTFEEDNEYSESNLIYLKKPELTFDNIILNPTIKMSIEDALWQYQYGEEVYEKYGLKDKIPYGRAVAMLFYGPPGTGKTATAEAIAKQLGKKIGIVNYDKILSNWVGQSQQNLVRCFEEAEYHDCVLLFDEADALFAKRIEESHSADRMHNNLTNLLMQKLERTKSLIILTTNREVIFDKAFERRLLLKLKFDLPSFEARIKIWHMFLKDCSYLSSDVSFEELAKYAIVGGKIKNVILKTVIKCAKNNRPISQADLLFFIKQETQDSFCQAKPIGFKI